MSRVEIVDIDEIQELLLAYAEGDYSRRLKISDDRDSRDILVAGINMLGEELEESTVSKDYFRSIYNAISNVVVVTDLEGIVTSVNNASLNTMGEGLDEIIGKNILDLFAASSIHQQIADFMKGAGDVSSFDISKKIGEEMKYFSCTMSRIQSKFKVHEGYLVIVKDVTKEKNLEGEVLNAIIDTEEKERKRLANDLHDALGQELNSVKMMFESLTLMDRESSKYQEVLEICRGVIDDCIDSTRLLSYDLMPKTLDDEKLFYAFEELERKNKKLLSLNLFLPNEEFPISKKKKINIYRVVQEFITNSLKHSSADMIELKSFIEDDIYVFEMADNGQGFDLSQTSSGRGLKNIQSRLKAIEAEYQMASSIDCGTYLKFSFK